MPQPLTGIVVLVLCVLLGSKKAGPISMGPVTISDRACQWILVGLLVLAVVFVVAPIANLLYNSSCPAGQHPVGGNAGTDVECVASR
jgi:hypothetical protein